MERMNVSSGTPWEERIGHSRAIRVGEMSAGAGTKAVDDAGAIVGEGDPYGQTVFASGKIESALPQVGPTSRMWAVHFTSASGRMSRH